jgi:arylsulfatase A-like enzyme
VGFPGASLARFWSEAPSDSLQAPEPILSELATRRGRGPFSLIQGDYHYVAWQGQDKPAELYHLQNDPWETTKLTDSLQIAQALIDFQRWSETLMGKGALAARAPAIEEDEDPAAPQ